MMNNMKLERDFQSEECRTGGLYHDSTSRARLSQANFVAFVDLDRCLQLPGALQWGLWANAMILKSTFAYSLQRDLIYCLVGR